MCVGMCVDMCVGMCVDMSADMCVDMCADMCVDMCADMCVDTSADMCVDMCVDRRAHLERLCNHRHTFAQQQRGRAGEMLHICRCTCLHTCLYS